MLSPSRGGALDEKRAELSLFQHASGFKMPSRASLPPLKSSLLIPNWRATKNYPTSWLDGIRGYACFIVFIFHFQFIFHVTFKEGYSAAEDHKGFIQLPFVRLLVNGLPMVNIFFVLSGIALSLKPIQLARSGKWDQFFDTMFSSFFRRALRLYIPVFSVQAIYLILICMGFYNWSSEMSRHWSFIGTNDLRPIIRGTVMEQVHDWFNVMTQLANPFRMETFWALYDGHLWTIPVEFRCSMIVFGALMAFSRLQSRIRITLTIMLYLYSEYVEGKHLGLFVSGIVLAEFLVIRDEREKATQLPTTKIPTEKKVSGLFKAFWISVFIFGLHLLNWPPNSDSAYGYVYMDSLVRPYDDDPQNRGRRVGAIVFMTAICAYDALRKPFQTPLARYMGKISFAMYIVHGPIEHLFGTRLVSIFWDWFGNETDWKYEMGVWIPFIITAAVVIRVADLVTRHIDGPSVRFGRWLQNKWTT